MQLIIFTLFIWIVEVVRPFEVRGSCSGSLRMLLVLWPHSCFDTRREKASLTVRKKKQIPRSALYNILFRWIAIAHSSIVSSVRLHCFNLRSGVLFSRQGAKGTFPTFYKHPPRSIKERPIAGYCALDLTVGQSFIKGNIFLWHLKNPFCLVQAGAAHCKIVNAIFDFNNLRLVNSLLKPVNPKGFPLGFLDRYVTLHYMIHYIPLFTIGVYISLIRPLEKYNATINSNN